MTFTLSTCAAALAQLGPDTIKPYPLPTGVHRSVNELAAQSDVLILGEIHGTQEVPAVAAALLAPLTKLGYRVLALEVPADQHASLTAWATGKTTAVPSFFTMPSEDGRGSIEALKLIHTALSPPFCWKLICFDVTEEEIRLAAITIPSANVVRPRQTTSIAHGGDGTILPRNTLVRP